MFGVNAILISVEARMVYMGFLQVCMESCRHGILFISSTIQNQQFSSYCKISEMFSLFIMIFHVINTSYYEERAKYGLKQLIFIKTFHELGFHTN